MTGIEEDELALKILADLINQKEDELINLQASYAKLGGIFDGDEDVKPAKQKLLTGPKPKKKKSKRKSAPPPVERGARGTFTLNGHSIEMTQRQANLLDLMNRAAGRLLSKPEIITIWGTAPSWSTLFNDLNIKLKQASVQIVNVRGQGYRLEKHAA